MSIVQTTDFQNGEYRLPSNRFTDAQYESIISVVEREWLIKLLGAELYALFYADLVDGLPQATKYLTIFNPFAEDIGSGIVNVSVGIKEMLKGIVYYKCAIESNFVLTMNGLVTNNTENAILANTEQGMQHLTAKLGNAMKTFTAIQKYIVANIDSYPEYNGIKTDVVMYYW